MPGRKTRTSKDNNTEGICLLYQENNTFSRSLAGSWGHIANIATKEYALFFFVCFFMNYIDILGELKFCYNR